MTGPRVPGWLREFLRTPIGASTGGLYLLTLAFAVWLGAGQPDFTVPLVRGFTLVLLALPNAVFVWAAFALGRSSTPRLRRCWWLLAGSRVAFSAGDVLQAGLGDPVVSVADVFFVGAYVLVLAGLIGLPFVAVSRRERILFSLDMGLVLTACVTLSGFALASTLPPLETAGIGVVANLTYPVLDILMIAAAVALLQHQVEGVSGATLTFLALGLAMSLADSASYVVAVAQGVTDPQEGNVLLWLAARVLHATAPAWELFVSRSATTQRVADSRSRVLIRQALPYLAGAASLMLLMAVVVGGVGGPRLIGVAAGTILVTAVTFYRQFVVLQENLRLNAMLREHMQLQADVERLARHDLKTPLTGIIAIPQRLLQSPTLSPEQADLVRQIERSGYRLLGMVNLSLDLLRMEQGRYQFEPRAVDVFELARRVALDLERQAASKRVELRVTGAETASPWAWAEELLSYSMLANLMKNALEASPEGAPVTVSFHDDAGALRIRVHNHGVVPEELRAGFFDRYSTAGKREGTGLGTYSAKLMAETQGGRIDMSTGTQGTTVEIVLPAATAPETQPGDAPEATASSRDARPDVPALALGPLRVLVVDDDGISAAILRAALPSPPLVVDVAINGREALDKLDAFRPDLVFMDREMPVMDGLQATARLRSWEARRDGHRAFVVGVSADDDPQTRRLLLEAGCDRYLVKPLEPEQIQAVLREASQAHAVADPD